MPLNPEDLARFQAMEAAHPAEPPQPAGAAALGCQKTWVAVELLDAAGQPVAGAEYLITLPDGSTRRGRLDANGYAIERDVGDAGQCTVEFPGSGPVRPR